MVKSMSIIYSEQNKWIKKIKALQTRKYREKYKQFFIEGIRFCQEAIKSESNIEALFISKEVIDEQRIKDILSTYNGQVFIVENKLLEKYSDTINPQGIGAIINKPVWNLNDILNKNTVIILDRIQDPGNLGTIIRTALGANVDGIICLKGTVDIFNDKVLRSTMGAIFNIPVLYIDDIKELITLLKEKDFKIVVADAEGDAFYFTYKYPARVALVLGNEGNGPQHLSRGDIRVSIPLNPKAESLNVAIAGGIILYEIYRQRFSS